MKILRGIGDSRWFLAYIPVHATLSATSILIPLYTLRLNGTVADVGIIASAFSATFIIFSIVWGRLSDCTGRRRIFILGGLASPSPIFTLFALAQRTSDLVILNTLMGVAFTASVPTTSMLILETFPRAQWDRRIGFFSATAGVGSNLGMAAGGIFMTLLSPRAFFLICAFASLVGFLMASALIEPPSPLGGTLHP